MQHELSNREHLILTLASKGFTDDMIARELGIKRGTVNSYWVRIRAKFGPLSRTELVARFVQKNADEVFSERGDQLETEAAELASTESDPARQGKR